MNDFADRFSWDRYLAAPARPSRTGRSRQAYLGTLNGVVVVAIVSPLGTEALSVVSIRPANTKERADYDEKD